MLLALQSGHAADAAPRDGEAREGAGSFDVYDAVQQRWSTPLQFWLDFAARRGGPTWGRSATFPPYAQVKELDTFLAETAHGPCLMQFFHRRWRRANDVQRWNDRFNSFGGCARVFE